MKGKGLSETCGDEVVDVVAKPAHCESGGVGIMLNLTSEVRIRFAGFGERLGVRLILMVKVLAKELYRVSMMRLKGAEEEDVGN